MSALQIVAAATKAGIRLEAEGVKLIAECEDEIPASILANLKRHKSEILNELKRLDAVDKAAERLAAEGAKTAKASRRDLYETQADYARALIRYARHDRLHLTVKNGRLAITVDRNSDADLIGELHAQEAALIKVLTAEPRPQTLGAADWEGK